MTESSPPNLLFYCQHSLGIGHLTRSFALARALRERFRVVFLNGGKLPQGVSVPTGVSCIHLPPLGMDDGHTVVSRDTGIDVGAARAERRQLIGRAVEATQPAVLIVELFPFGRKKFADEILPMIRAARRQGAKVVCSLRDILVDARPDQQHHDDRAAWLVNRYFDAVLVHSDAAFARLEETFRPRRTLRTPVWHTGFVVPERRVDAHLARGEHVVVSAGGGIVGDSLFRAALEAHRPHRRADADRRRALPARAAVAGAAARGRRPSRRPAVSPRVRPGRRDVHRAGVDQPVRLQHGAGPGRLAGAGAGRALRHRHRERAAPARRALAALGAVQCLDPDQLDGPALAVAIVDLLQFRPRPAALSLSGARRSAELLAQLVAQRAVPAAALEAA
jgi:predicted glycosyltransferase